MDASSSRPIPDELRPLLVDAAVTLTLVGRAANHSSRRVPRRAITEAANALIATPQGDAVRHLLDAGMNRSSAYRMLELLSATLESVTRLSITAASADADKLAEAILGHDLRC